MNKLPIGIAAVGDVLDINCWSNIPYFFYQEGHKAGLFNQPWSLHLQHFNTSRKLWNIQQLLLGKGKGGYQFSASFLNKAEASIPTGYFSSQVISFNQLFPRASSVVDKGGSMYYFIDTTLADLFKEESYGLSVPKAVQEKAIAQEKENYRLATKVVSMGTWSHTSLKEVYHLPEDKISQILPGANINLPEGWVPPQKHGQPGVDRDIILGFIGKDWERKGLPLLLDVRDILEQKGFKAIVKAVGNCPASLASRKGLNYTGFIDKQNNSRLFLDTIASCDLGCLFSASEALGISTLEFIRAGVPVTGYYHQGLQNTLLPSCSIRFSLQDSKEAIANQFIRYITDTVYQESLIEGATNASSQVTWQQTVNQWQQLLH